MEKIKIDKIVRSNRKTIGLHLSKDAKLTIKAPLGVSQKEIESIVEKKRNWIVEKINELKIKDINKPIACYENGAVFYYLGKPKKLIINKDKKTALKIAEECFYLSEYHLPHAAGLFRYFYKEQSRRFFNNRAREISKHTGIDFKVLKISEAKKRWGSCSSSGNLNISWRLLMAPEYVINYILIHELAHRVELNHSRRFWDIVERIDPNYKISEKWLKDNSMLLEFEF